MDPLSQLPTDLLILITVGLSAEDVFTARLVCSSWEHAFSRALLTLRPNALAFHKTLSYTFPALQHLSLSRCNQKHVTDAHVSNIAKLNHLQDLSLRNCWNLTGTSAAALCSLLSKFPAYFYCRVTLVGRCQTVTVCMPQG